MQPTTNPISGITKAPDTEKTDSKESVKAQEKPPQMKSQQRSKIIVREDGRRFKNGVELFYEKDGDGSDPVEHKQSKTPKSKTSRTPPTRQPSNEKTPKHTSSSSFSSSSAAPTDPSVSTQ